MSSAMAGRTSVIARSPSADIITMQAVANPKAA